MEGTIYTKFKRGTIGIEDDKLIVTLHTKFLGMGRTLKKDESLLVSNITAVEIDLEGRLMIRRKKGDPLFFGICNPKEGIGRLAGHINSLNPKAKVIHFSLLIPPPNAVL